MLKFIALFVIVLGTVQAYDAPAIATQEQNILRSYGNLGQLSTYSKTIDTPFSSVRKADIRLSNPGLTIASPYAHPAYAAPISPYPSPYVSHVSPYGPIAKTVATPGGLLGVAYSAAPAVAHMTYSNGLGVNYAW